MQEYLKTLTDIVNLQKDEIAALQAEVAELKAINPMVKKFEYINAQTIAMNAIMPFLGIEQQIYLVTQIVNELFGDEAVTEILKGDFNIGKNAVGNGVDNSTNDDTATAEAVGTVDAEPYQPEIINKKGMN